ncbi:hypothetical protein [Lysinibacillus sp. G4S2]|uniref:hypothetical protein n=1 Tax=Lysinibacillus sp. G4S2 TaxID=3055859 RepID=UPI0025A09611|nr:hypothetical protein [Lysinibacillus sp. G4S2]MDM5245768.1 hypothetical protein [Lysinibacillus sp. G4S2]
MTENNILNLPTYEQVEQIKENVGEVKNTSGQLLDINNMQYKAIVQQDAILSPDYIDPIEVATKKFFEANPDELVNYRHYAQTPYIIGREDYDGGNLIALRLQTIPTVVTSVTSYNLDTSEIVNHVRLPEGFKFLYQVNPNWITTTDDKYLYILGQQGTQISLAVLDKNTLAIKKVLVTASTNINVDALAGNVYRCLIIRDNVMHFTLRVNDDTSTIYGYDLNKDVNGVPTTLNYNISYVQSYNDLPNVATLYNLFESKYNDFIYIVGRPRGNTTISFVKARLVAGKLQQVSALVMGNTSSSSWGDFLEITDKKAWVQVGSGGLSSLNVVNLETMTLMGNIGVNNLGYILPLTADFKRIISWADTVYYNIGRPVGMVNITELIDIENSNTLNHISTPTYAIVPRVTQQTLNGNAAITQNGIFESAGPMSTTIIHNGQTYARMANTRDNGFYKVMFSSQLIGYAGGN